MSELSEMSLSDLEKHLKGIKLNDDETTSKLEILGLSPEEINKGIEHLIDSKTSPDFNQLTKNFETGNHFLILILENIIYIICKTSVL